MRNLVLIFLLSLSSALFAESSDYYEEHLAIASPIGEISIGRSMAKGGWIYGYGLFNKTYDEEAIKGYLKETSKTKECPGELLPGCTHATTGELTIFAVGKGVSKITEAVTCDVQMEFDAEARSAWQNVGWEVKNAVSKATNCEAKEIAHFLPSKNQLITKLGYETQPELEAAVTAALQERDRNFFRSADESEMEEFKGIKFTGSLIAEYYDPETEYTYGIDTLVRYVRRQNGEKVLFEWDSFEADTTVLVPNKITTSTGESILDIETQLVDDYDLTYIVPTKITDKSGRVFTYTYDGARLKTFTDARNNTWTYHYKDFSPEAQPLDRLIRLDTVEDPNGNHTQFLYQPASAVLVGYKTAAGDGFYREVVETKNSFGEGRKIESKIYHDGRVEERIYDYTELYDVPNISTDETALVQKEKVLAPQATAESGTQQDYAPYLWEPEKQQTYMYARATSRLVYVSYGQIKAAQLKGQTLKEYAQAAYGSSSSGGGLAGPTTDSIRVLQEVRINGETLYRFKDSFSNVDGLEISKTVIESPLGYTKEVYKYFDDFSRASIPGSSVVIKSTDMEDERLVFNEYGHVSRRTRGNIVENYKTDLYGNVLEETVEEDGVTAFKAIYEYNPSGNLTKVTYPAINGGKLAEYNYEYDANQLLIKEIDAEGNTQTYSGYNVTGQAKTRVDLIGKTHKYEYDANGNLTKYTDPKNHAYVYSYDKVNELYETLNPDTTKESYTLDKDGYAISTTDELGHAVDYTFDASHQVTSITEPKDADNASIRKWTYAYNNHRKLEKFTEPGGQVTQYKYNLDQLQSIEYPAYKVAFTHNGQGQISKSVWSADDGSKKEEAYGFDALGRQTNFADGLGNVTGYEYDSLDRVKTITDADNGTISFNYDGRGNLLSVLDQEGRSISFEYNLNDWAVKETRHNGETRQYDYWPNGKIKTVIDAKGQVSRFAYDDNANLTTLTRYALEASEQASQTITFTYDNRNRMKTYDDGDTSGTFDYNLRGDLIGMSVNYGPFSKSHSYDYYPNRNLKSYTNPEGVTYTYGYSANNDLQTVMIPSIGQLIYNGYEWLVPNKLMFPGGSEIDLSHDGFSRLTGFSLKDSTDQTVNQATYQVDAESNLTAITNSPMARTMGYNKKHQLTSSTDTTNAGVTTDITTYQYDGVGNRTALNGEVWEYNNNDQLVKAGTRTFEYDNNGALTKILDNDQSIRFFEYNVNGRLSAVKNGDATLIAKYGYGPFGHRLWKEVDNQRTYYHYNTSGLAGEYNQSGQLIAEYHYSPARTWSTVPQFTRQNGQVYFYQNEYRNAPETIIDQAGKVVWQATYDDFGSANVVKADIQNPIRLPGQYFDVETGLHYNFKRYYDPTFGRYLSEDPLGFDGSGVNYYAYASVNPYKYYDPRGEYAMELACFAITAASGCPDFTCLIPGGGAWKAGKNAYKAAKKAWNNYKKNKKKPGCNGCFSEDTPVIVLAEYTDQQVVDAEVDDLGKESSKSIKDIQLGDYVLAKNVVTDEVGFKPVVELFVFDDRGVYELILQNESGEITKIEVTDDHPFWIPDFGWMDSIDLVPGLTVDSRSGEVLTVIDFKFLNKFEKTYNLSVSDWHTYYVSDSGVLVHNCPEYGSYTNTHASGKKYHGKGSRKRSQQSGRRQARNNNDPHTSTDWTPSKSDRDAFKDESRRIDSDGGVGSSNNYNKSESPGKKYRQQDGDD